MKKTLPHAPWPLGKHHLMALRSIRPGVLLAPFEWEVQYLKGKSALMPWASINHPPITVRILPPGAEATWQQVTKISCTRPGSPAIYYSGRPDDLVRVIVPSE